MLRKKAARRAQKMIVKESDAIAFESCINKATQNEYQCPYYPEIKENTTKTIDEHIKIID